jgi:hypothetical protein
MAQRACSSTCLEAVCLASPTPADVLTLLYAQNCCVVAHGQYGVRVLTFTSTVGDIVKDGCIVHLLARMAVEERAPRSRCRDIRELTTHLD